MGRHCPPNKLPDPIWSTRPAPCISPPFSLSRGPCWHISVIVWDISQHGPLIFSSCCLLMPSSTLFIIVRQLPNDCMHTCLVSQTQITIAQWFPNMILLFLMPHWFLSLFIFLGKDRGSRFALSFVVVFLWRYVLPTYESNFLINKANKEWGLVEQSGPVRRSSDLKKRLKDQLRRMILNREKLTACFLPISMRCGCRSEKYQLDLLYFPKLENTS